MAIAPDYCTLQELKDHLRVTDTVDDDALEVAITAASRAIDHEANTVYGLTGSAVPRVYGYDSQLFIDGQPALRIDQVQTSVGMVVKTDLDNDGVYETTLSLGSDVDLWPYNAPTDGAPWTHLVLNTMSDAYFPWTSRGVQVTANWGYTTVPAVVKQACLIQAARFFVRRDSAYGVAGSPDVGSEVRLLARLDPDVALLISVVKRHWGAV